MTNDELRALIKGHCDAMLAQVDDPKVKLEYLADIGWHSAIGGELFERIGPHSRCWHRLAPAPRMVPLDQSDFLGPNRVTHVRPNANPEHTYAVVHCSDGLVSFGGGTSTSYRTLHEGWKCSRDFGATWEKCEKPA